MSKNRVLRFAPSYLPAPPRTKPTPQALLERVLAGLPNRSLVHGGRFGPSPPPRNALWLDLDYTPASTAIDTLRAKWQATLVAGAVRDLMCTNRERPLVWWNGEGGYTVAFGQQFPNLSPAEFRARVATAARILGLTVVSVSMLRPLQLAPDVVVQAPNRLAFVHEQGALDLYLFGDSFEGFFLEAQDPDGTPFYAISNTRRGIAMTASWACRRRSPSC